jgi:hypothetical protein
MSGGRSSNKNEEDPMPLGLSLTIDDGLINQFMIHYQNPLRVSSSSSASASTTSTTTTTTTNSTSVDQIAHCPTCKCTNNLSSEEHTMSEEKMKFIKLCEAFLGISPRK